MVRGLMMKGRQRHTWLIAGAAIAVALAAVGCDSLFAPLPSGAKGFPPLAPYGTWWQLVESCSGITRTFGSVRWYVADRIESNDANVDGEWLSRGNRIVLTPASAREGSVVRHEMLHALLGHGGHPREYFVDRCGSLVSCQANCAPSEGDRGVPSTALYVPLMTLEVSVRVEPAVPNVSIDSGWARIVVDVTNPRSEPVWVDLLGFQSFSWHSTQAPWSREVGTSERLWAFRAGECRSYTFDAQFGVGTYTIHGGFSVHGSPGYVLTVGE